MTKLWQALTTQPKRSIDLPLTMDAWTSYFGFGGLDPFAVQTTYGSPQQGEKIEASFRGYTQAAYKQNGIIFACMLVRMLLFSEARFQFRAMRNGRPGKLFGTQDLQVLEQPWVNGTTGDLLARMIQDVDIGGNFYGQRTLDAGGRPTIMRRRPDWVTIILGSRSGSEYDTELLGYSYQPGGPASGEDPIALLPEEVVHFAPIPDPIARYRGMSWLTPILREIVADDSMIIHKQKFFDNAATANMVVTLGNAGEELTPKQFDEWVDKFEGGHEGLLNAYRTIYLAAGADAKVVGADMRQMDFKEVQSHTETRIAAAAGVPPVIVGFSEGLSSATYSNYSQARRRFADGTMRPLWRNAAASLATVVKVPAGSELWYDDRDVPFLREDVKDEADIQQTKSLSIRALVDSGFTAESVIAAIEANDMSLLVHSGLFSVQLQSPGATKMPIPSLVQPGPDTGTPAAPSNGKPAPAAAP